MKFDSRRQNNALAEHIRILNQKNFSAFRLFPFHESSQGSECPSRGCLSHNQGRDKPDDGIHGETRDHLDRHVQSGKGQACGERDRRGRDMRHKRP